MQREDAREYTSLTPLNRLVDAVRPESEKARIFAGMVDHLSANKDAVRKQLITWRDSREELLPLLQQSALLEEDIPLAEDLSAVARAGLEALDYLDSGMPAPPDLGPGAVRAAGLGRQTPRGTAADDCGTCAQARRGGPGGAT